MRFIVQVGIGAAACAIVGLGAPLIGEPEPGFVSAAMLLIGGMVMRSVP